MYKNSSYCIKTKTATTLFFKIISGVCQGCILSHLLFLTVMDFDMINTVTANNSPTGILLAEQMDTL